MEPAETCGLCGWWMEVENKESQRQTTGYGRCSVSVNVEMTRCCLLSAPWLTAPITIRSLTILGKAVRPASQALLPLSSSLRLSKSCDQRVLQFTVRMNHDRGDGRRS